MVQGAQENGANWLAMGTSAVINRFGNASFRVFVNDGLTAGNTFSPTEVFRIDVNRTGVGGPATSITGSQFQVLNQTVLGTGFLQISLDDVGSTSQTILPTTIGTVSVVIHVTGRHSAGGSTTGVIRMSTSAATTDTISFPGSNVYTFTLASGGVTVARTSGSGTADLSCTVTYG
jgi:hypothetical protein